MSHSWSPRREKVDSRLLVVGSQTTSLTPGPSFAHNLGWRCPNDQCKAIFDIYVSRPFQWHQERLNARCFGPCCRALNIRESRRTPSSQLWECWASPPHLAQSKVATLSPTRRKGQCPHWHLEFFLLTIAIAFFWILGHLPTFAAWTLSQANLGVPKFPTLSWQVQEGLMEKPSSNASSKETKLA
jgi:hypothetical protein